MNKQLKQFLLKILFFTVPIFLLFEIFFRVGLYPLLTDSEIFDWRIIYMQKRHVNDIKIMAMGSSCTLYSLEDSVIASNFNLPYYNMATWGVQMSQNEALSKDWVKKYKPKYIILCSVTNDFMAATSDANMMKYANTPNFIKSNFMEFFYFNNYNSISSLLRRRFFPFMAFKLTIPNRWGGDLIPYFNQRRLSNAWEPNDMIPNQYTEGNYRALNGLATYLKKEKVKLIFIQAPMSNSRAGNSIYQQMLDKHFTRCMKIVEATNGTYLNYYNPKIYADSLFYDKDHMYAAGAHIFTNQLVKDLKKIIKE
jgi:hypothetical protein